jgi:hypothetical protein
VSGTFNYIATKVDGDFHIHQARLFLNTGTPHVPNTHFVSANVRAGSYRLSDLGLRSRDMVSHLLSGRFPTPHGELVFSPNEAGNYLATYDPLHPEGQSAQARLDILTVQGGRIQSFMSRPLLDWELKASLTPYDNFQELAAEYLLGTVREYINVEVVASNIALVDGRSTINGSVATLALRLAPTSSSDAVTLGYRIFSGGRVTGRASVPGSDVRWVKADEYQYGTIEVTVPLAAVLHCIVSYRGVAQHYYWVADPTTVQNARRVVYETADNQLEILNDVLTKSQTRGRDARELEAGVAWLLWMLGFSVAHLGSTPRMQDAIDLIATTPNGNFAVIECTTGLLVADKKLSRLVERTENIRRRLSESGNHHVRVLAAIITSKTRGEVIADIEQAEKLNILVLTREELELSVNRTLVQQNAEQIFEQAEQSVQAAAAKYFIRPVSDG